jgi:hypothetical protein
MERPCRVNTRDICPREAQVKADKGGKEMGKRITRMDKIVKQIS